MKEEKVLVTRAEQSRVEELQVQEEEADRTSASSPIPLGEWFEMEDDIYRSEPVDEEVQSTPDGQGCESLYPLSLIKGQIPSY